MLTPAFRSRLQEPFYQIIFDFYFQKLNGLPLTACSGSRQKMHFGDFQWGPFLSCNVLFEILNKIWISLSSPSFLPRIRHARSLVCVYYTVQGRRERFARAVSLFNFLSWCNCIVQRHGKKSTLTQRWSGVFVWWAAWLGLWYRSRTQNVKLETPSYAPSVTLSIPIWIIIGNSFWIYACASLLRNNYSKIIFKIYGFRNDFLINNTG